VSALGPEEATCEVLVFREGLLSSIGHDLLLRVTAFEIAVAPDRTSVSARFDASSLRVVLALRDGRPLPGALGPADVRKIEGAISETVLRARRFPEIRFASTAVGHHDGGYHVSGGLTLRGVTRSLTLTVQRHGDRLTTEIAVHQPDFGIQPYRALMGALRVKEDVLVRISVPDT
jgi:polyisoprenoid-binding protein YceI